MIMIKDKLVALLSGFGPTRWLLAQKRQWQEKRRQERFATCSPEVVPVLKRAFQETQQILGDYYEFGMFKGYLFYQAQKIAQGFATCHEMNFYGFDSFAGLPEVRGPDSGWRFRAGMYACDYDRVRRALDDRGVDWSHTFLLKGFFSDTLRDQSLLSNYKFGKAKVVLIDCDLYESTKDVLAFIGRYLQDGTMVIMDDWNCFDADENKGQRLALREFLASNKKLSFSHVGDYGWHGAYFRVGLSV